MVLKQIITQNPMNPILEIIKNKYPLFFAYFSTKFGEYELKYSAPIFCEQLLSITQQYSTELQALELSQGLDIDKIGTVRTTKNDKKVTETYNTKDSYKGFNVQGDFAIVNQDKDLVDETDDVSIEQNYYKFLLSINDTNFSKNWKNIEREITSLFIMYCI